MRKMGKVEEVRDDSRGLVRLGVNRFCFVEEKLRKREAKAARKSFSKGKSLSSGKITHD